MNRKGVVGAVLGAAMLLPLSAGAAGVSKDVQNKVQDQIGPTAKVGAFVTGGIADYTGTLGSTTIVGPTWGVAAEAMNENLYGLEIGYEGSKTPIHDSRVAANNQSIWRHGIEAFGKVGPNIHNFRPFGGIGLQESYVNVTDKAEESGAYRSDFMMEVPLGAGVEYSTGVLKVGLRGTYRFLFFDEFAERTPSSDNPQGGLLGGQLTAGGTF